MKDNTMLPKIQQYERDYISLMKGNFAEILLYAEIEYKYAEEGSKEQELAKDLLNLYKDFVKRHI